MVQNLERIKLQRKIKGIINKDTREEGAIKTIVYYRCAAQEGELLPVEILEEREDSIKVSSNNSAYPEFLHGWFLSSAFVSLKQAEELCENFRQWENSGWSYSSNLEYES